MEYILGLKETERLGREMLEDDLYERKAMKESHNDFIERVKDYVSRNADYNMKILGTHNGVSADQLLNWLDKQKTSYKESPVEEYRSYVQLEARLSSLEKQFQRNKESWKILLEDM